MLDIRKTIQVSILKKNGIDCIHFYGIPKLSGHKGTLYFPYDANVSLFVQIEKIMLLNGMCHNVANVVPNTILSNLKMYYVTYNRVKPKK